MKKLDKAALAERDQIIGRLQSLYSDLESAVEAFNDKMGVAWNIVEAAVEAYNTTLDDEWGSGLGPVIEQYDGAVADANQWKQDAAQSIQDYMDERSEKWQESDAAQNYCAWRDEFDHEFPAFDQERPEDISVEQPDEISFDIDDVGELLGELPQELESQG